MGLWKHSLLSFVFLYSKGGTYMNKTGVEVTKAATAVVTMYGCAKIVDDAIDTFMPVNAKFFHKAAVKISGYILSSILGDVVSEWTNNKIDAAAKAIENGDDLLDVLI